MSQFRCEEVWIPQRLGFYHISIIKEKGNKRVPVFKRHDYKQYCDEHWGTRVTFNSGFLSVYASSGIGGSYGGSISSFFFKESPHCAP